MENTKNGTKPADCRRKNAAAETIIIEQNGTNSPWVGCINSVNYRIERGVPVEVPAAVAAVIKMSSRQLTKAAKAFGAQPHAFQRHTNAMLTPAECG